MRYARFEAVAFLVGSAAIISSLFMSSTSRIIPAEVVAQLLMILVLAGALHRGRNGGFVTALIATSLYVGMRYQLLTTQGLSTDVISMMLTRVLGYALVGVVGGELAGRAKYFLTRDEADTMIDPVTRVYSARYAGRAITTAVGRHQRYGTVCSAVCITVSPAVWASLKPSRMGALMRRIASHLRGDVRIVDDVAYRGNGSFVIILPETDGDGAAVAATRLRAGVAGVIGCDHDDITTRVLSCGTDDVALVELAHALAPDRAGSSA